MEGIRVDSLVQRICTTAPQGFPAAAGGRRRNATNRFVSFFLAAACSDHLDKPVWMMRPLGRDRSHASILSESKRGQKNSPAQPEKAKIANLKGKARNCLRMRSRDICHNLPEQAIFLTPNIVSVEPSLKCSNWGPCQFCYERGMDDPR